MKPEKIESLGIEVCASPLDLAKLTLALAGGLALAMAVARFRKAHDSAAALMRESDGDPAQDALEALVEEVTTYQRLMFQGSDALLGVHLQGADTVDLRDALQAMPDAAFPPSTDKVQ